MLRITVIVCGFVDRVFKTDKVSSFTYTLIVIVKLQMLAVLFCIRFESVHKFDGLITLLISSY